MAAVTDLGLISPAPAPCRAAGIPEQGGSGWIVARGTPAESVQMHGESPGVRALRCMYQRGGIGEAGKLVKPEEAMTSLDPVQLKRGAVVSHRSASGRPKCFFTSLLEAFPAGETAGGSYSSPKWSGSSGRQGVTGRKKGGVEVPAHCRTPAPLVCLGAPSRPGGCSCLSARGSELRAGVSPCSVSVVTRVVFFLPVLLRGRVLQRSFSC